MSMLILTSIAMVFSIPLKTSHDRHHEPNNTDCHIGNDSTLNIDNDDIWVVL